MRKVLIYSATLSPNENIKINAVLKARTMRLSPIGNRLSSRAPAALRYLVDPKGEDRRFTAVRVRPQNSW